MERARLHFLSKEKREQRPWGRHSLGMLTRDSMEADVLNVDQVRKRDRGKEIRKNSERAHISWDLMSYTESSVFNLNMKAR